jgi:hypothetical protein
VRVSVTDAVLAAGIDGSDLPAAGVSIVPMPRIMQALVGRHVRAMTLRRTILVSPGEFDGVVRGTSKQLLAHELIHVGQWGRDGVVGFVVWYVGDYVRLRVIGLDHADAYRHIGYEYAAYAGAARIVDQS